MLRQCRRFASLGLAFLQTQPPGGVGQPTNQSIVKFRNSMLHHVNMQQRSPICLLYSATGSAGNSSRKYLNKKRRAGVLTHNSTSANASDLSCVSISGVYQADVRGLNLWSKHFFSDTEKDKKAKEGSELSEDAQEEANLTVFQRFKAAYKHHGKILLAVHVATSAVWFVGFYYIATSGIDVISVMEHYNLPPAMISPFRHAGLGDLAVMYLLYKLATPLRYTVTLAGTNLTLRYLKSAGYIEPVAPEDSLRGLMKDGSVKLKVKRSELVEQSKERMRAFRDKDKDAR